jgi:hypothetical protein
LPFSFADSGACGRSGSERRGPVRVLLVAVTLIALVAPALAFAEENDLPPAPSVSQEYLETIAKKFQTQLDLPVAVLVSVIEKNKFLVSVHRSKELQDTFVILFEREFLSTLTEEEARAVIAHEMGHIWIFTHHPYLQTEALANQKAAELVPRDSLRDVYEKVWRIEGQKVTLEEFLARVE